MSNILNTITITLAIYIVLTGCFIFKPRWNYCDYTVIANKLSITERDFAIFINGIYIVYFLTDFFRLDWSSRGFHDLFSIVLNSNYNLIFSLGIDGISYWLLLLTAFITMLCCALVDEKKAGAHALLTQILLISCGLLLTFLCTNLLFFYVCFEALLIPLFLMIGIFGSNRSKVKAAYYLVIYTLLGSFCLLFAIFYLFTTTVSLEFSVLKNINFSQTEQIILFLLFFLPFAVKIPMWPFHIWLPAAHVEAPTTGSVILASLILKLGGYGLLRFMPWFPLGLNYWESLIQVCALIGMFYGACVCIIQFDLKRFVAYTSVSHMNLMLLGLISKNVIGITGAYYLMISHSIVSAALFICIGIIYARYHTRNLYYLSGLGETMPLFSIFYFIFTLANMGTPLTANFVGELLIFIGLAQESFSRTCLVAITIVLSAIYSVWAFNRLVFGTTKTLYRDKFLDINRTEFIILMSLAILLVFFGLSGTIILDSINTPCIEISMKFR